MTYSLGQFRALAATNLEFERFQHTVGVEVFARDLSKKYGIDPEAVSLAALTHDLAKMYSRQVQIQKAKEWNLIHYPEDLENPQVIHGRVAAYMLEHEYGIKDNDILNAVANHTLGRPGMSPLEMLIYSADMTEPGRDFPGVDKLREKLYDDLTEGTLACIEHTLDYLHQLNKPVHPLTILTYEDLKKTTRIKGGSHLVIGPNQLTKVADLISDKKGSNVTILDLKGISIIADYFVIATGNTKIQTKAITDHLSEYLPQIGIPVIRTEGLPEAQWVLLDCGDLVIHIMTPETREFYSLERLWGDAQEVVL